MSVNVKYGADEQNFENLVGIDIGNAIAALRGIMAVPADVSPRLNGNTDFVNSRILVDGDEIVFYKESGDKGL